MFESPEPDLGTKVTFVTLLTELKQALSVHDFASHVGDFVEVETELILKDKRKGMSQAP